MPKMKAAVVPAAGARFEIVERDVPQPQTGQVRIQVRACGICFSDHIVKDGIWPGLKYPAVPGHEIAGVIDEIGPGVTTWKKGQRVGVGWHGGHDFTCPACRAGDFINCSNERITGVHFDGGYQELMLVSAEAVAALPESLDFAEAAPLLCAGVTTFNSLRHSGARPGDLVAVLGVGGLGHLGIQFAQKAGYRVVAVGRGSDNAPLARKLGATVYIDSKASNAAEELQKLGGAQVILATAPSSQAMTDLVAGLGRNGKMIVLGAAPEALQLPPVSLIMGSKGLQGWASGTASDSEDTLRFAELTGVRPMIEKFPFAKVNDGFERMMSGHAQFRVVLTM